MKLYSITGTITYEVMTNRRDRRKIRARNIRIMKVSEFKPLYVCVN